MAERLPRIIRMPTQVDEAYSQISESRHSIVFPWLIKAILERTPSSVLDYGAGDGKLLMSLRDQFDGELFYFDPARRSAELEHRLNQKNIHVCLGPQSLRENTVDLIISTAVWMTLDTHDACIEYLSEQRRILKTGGRALISVTHPCFREERYSSFHTNFQNEDYSGGGSSFDVYIFDSKKEITLQDYHWNLSTMFAQASEVGFRLLRITEFTDTPSGNLRGSPWIMWEFAKE